MQNGQNLMMVTKMGQGWQKRKGRLRRNWQKSKSRNREGKRGGTEEKSEAIVAIGKSTSVVMKAKEMIGPADGVKGDLTIEGIVEAVLGRILVSIMIVVVEKNIVWRKSDIGRQEGTRSEMLRGTDIGVNKGEEGKGATKTCEVEEAIETAQDEAHQSTGREEVETETEMGDKTRIIADQIVQGVQSGPGCPVHCGEDQFDVHSLHELGVYGDLFEHAEICEQQRTRRYRHTDQILQYIDLCL
jgi:hypothetical protein